MRNVRTVSDVGALASLGPFNPTLPEACERVIGRHRPREFFCPCALRGTCDRAVPGRAVPERGEIDA